MAGTPLSCAGERITHPHAGAAQRNCFTACFHYEQRSASLVLALCGRCRCACAAHSAAFARRLSDERRAGDDAGRAGDRVVALALVAQDHALGARVAEEGAAAVLAPRAVLLRDGVALADGQAHLVER